MPSVTSLELMRVGLPLESTVGPEVKSGGGSEEDRFMGGGERMRVGGFAGCGGLGGGEVVGDSGISKSVEGV